MYKPTKGEVRLAIEMVEFFYPLYKKADLHSKAILVKEIFAFDVTVEEIERVAPFKQYLHKRVISGIKTLANGKQIQIKRVRRTLS